MQKLTSHGTAGVQNYLPRPAEAETMLEFHASEYVAFLHTVTPENLVSSWCYWMHVEEPLASLVGMIQQLAAGPPPRTRFRKGRCSSRPSP